MCGICGFNFADERLAKIMADEFKHRGPDQENYYSDSKVSLGHKRLSIIDLSEQGKQPMFNETKDIVIVFNGEIYNFMELKTDLEKKGHIFSSHTDTEVIIHAYEEYGTKCVNLLNGMWAFCIYDMKKKILFLSRDRFGKKPLYYYFDNDLFIFSSEIKSMLKCSIKKELNKTAVSSYLSYRYVLGEETFFKDIYKLLPAHNLIYNLDKKKIKKEEYWDIDSENKEIEEADAKTQVDLLLNKSVEYRKISDVPLGVILSGGLDSSIIAAMLANQEKNKINTFTVKFVESGFDETSFAKIVAEENNANYFEVTLDTSNFLDIMKEYTTFKDEPIGVPNEIALYLLSKKIKEKVTVVLSGEGADELFEGYGRIFSSVRDYNLLNNLKDSGIDNFKNKFPNLFNKYKQFFDSEIDHFLFLYNYWSDFEKNSILLKESKKNYSKVFKKYFDKYDIPYEKKISYVFLKLHLPGLLNRLDSPTMANSVEARAPFLDYLLASYVFNLQLQLKTKWNVSNEELMSIDETCDTLSENKNISKYILKQVAKDYIPETIINRKKQGFPLPLDKWFKEDFIDTVKDILLKEDSKIRLLIDQKKLELWINKKENIGNVSFGQKLWMILSLEIWLQKWFPEL